MSYLLLILLLLCLLFFAYKRKVGAFVCFTLFFFRVASTLLFTSSQYLYGFNSVLLGLSYIIVLLWQFNYFNWQDLRSFYMNPVVLSVIALSVIMIVHNDISPFFHSHHAEIVASQTSFFVNVFFPFILLPFFVPDDFTREKTVDSIPFWGLFYLVTLLVSFGFSSSVLNNRLLLEESTEGLISSIPLSRYMAIVATVCFIRSLSYKLSENSSRIGFICLALLFGLAMIIAGQRGTLIGFCLALFSLFLRAEYRSHAIAIIFISGFALLVVLSFFDIFQFQIFQRFAQFENIESFNRYYDYPRTWEIFSDNDFLWGLGTKGYLFQTGRAFPHNIILEHISDYGLLGLICILVLLAYCSKYAIKLIKYSNCYSDLAISCCWITICFSAMVSSSLIGHRLFYLLSGLLVFSHRYFLYRESQHPMTQDHSIIS